jgi:hypothetical protein
MLKPMRKEKQPFSYTLCDVNVYKIASRKVLERLLSHFLLVEVVLTNRNYTTS